MRLEHVGGYWKETHGNGDEHYHAESTSYLSQPELYKKIISALDKLAKKYDLKWKTDLTSSNDALWDDHCRTWIHLNHIYHVGQSERIHIYTYRVELLKEMAKEVRLEWWDEELLEIAKQERKWR
jgi:hypothetical protein